MFYVLRVRPDQERRLYARRELYIGIRRGWRKGSTLFFAIKTPADLLAGSGVLDKVIEIDAMDEQERRFCLQNNWYGKIAFERVERFFPPVSLQDTLLADVKPVLLHGLVISEEQANDIDNLVASRIVS